MRVVALPSLVEESRLCVVLSAAPGSLVVASGEREKGGHNKDSNVTLFSISSCVVSKFNSTLH